MKRQAAFRVAVAVAVLVCVGCKAPRESLRIASSYEIQTLDPHLKYTLSHSAVQFHFYEALVSTDSEMNIHPCLAIRWENPDAYTWIFHLRSSIRFHHGNPFSADDVLFTFKRLLGSMDLDAASSLVDVVEIKKIDSLTVLVKTAQPLTIFLNKVSLVAIVPQGSTAASLSTGENGTGPYRLAQWVRGERVEMIRNDGYWGPHPFAKNVTLYLGRSPQQAFDMLTSGRAELAQCNFQQVESKINEEKYKVLLHDSFFVKYLTFDLNREPLPGCSLKVNPFKNRLVRQAIHLAINRQDLVKRIPSHAVPATQLVPSLVSGFNPDLRLPPFDPEAAKKLLAEAGFPQGFEVTLHSRRILEATATMIQQYLQTIGIHVRLMVLPDDQFFPALRKGQAAFMLSRMGAIVGDASDIYESALHSPDAQMHYGSMNYLAYKNPEVDRLTELAAGIQMPDTRQDALKKIMSILMEDLAWIPLYVDQDVYAIDKHYSWNPRLDSNIFASEIRVVN